MERLAAHESGSHMIGTTTKPKIKDEIKVERPHLIGHRSMMISRPASVHGSESRISHERRSSYAGGDDRSLTRRCVVAVYTKDVAEAKATNATDAGRSKGYPLLFTTEPGE